MAGPGGIEAGRANLKVLPDLSQFLRSLERFIQRIERQVVVELPTTLDVKGVRESLAEVQARVRESDVEIPLKPDVQESEFRRARDGVQAQARVNPVTLPVHLDTNGLSRTLMAFTRTAGIAGLGIAAAGAVPQLLTLAGSLSQVAGAAALLPAAGAAGVAVIGTLAIGLQGVGDALKTAKTPAQAKQIAAAMAKLSPAARDVVKAIKGLGSGFSRLRLDVQQEMFAGLGKAVADLGRKYLPVLQGGLSKVGRGLNGMVRAFAGFLGDSGTVSALNGLFRDVQRSLNNLAPAVKPFLGALRDIGSVGGKFLPGLASSLADASKSFGGFIDKASKSGALQKFISDGLSALKDLASVAVSVGGILAGLVGAAQAAGGGTLSTLAGMLGKIADAVNSPAFQSGLTAFFSGVSDGASGLMSSALPAVAGLLSDLGPVIADFARQAGPALGGAIAAIAPLAGALVKAFSPAAVALIQAVADVIAKIAPTLTGWATALASVNPLLLGLAAVAVGLLPTLVSMGGVLLNVVRGFAAFAGLFAEGALLGGLGAIILPVLAVVAGVAALAAVFVLAYQNSQPIRDAVAQIGVAFAGMWAVVQPILAQLFAVIMENWPQIQALAAQVWSTVQTIILTVLVAIQRAVQLVTKIIQVVWAIFGDTILALVRVAFTQVIGVIRGALNIIQGVFRTVLALLRGDWSGAWDGIKQIVSGVWGIITSIVKGGLGTVVALVSGIGGQLYNAGAALIGKLVDGVKSKIADVGKAASAVADKIKGFFGGSPVEEGPLLGWNNGGAGKSLADKLAAGLDASHSRVAQAAAGLAAQIAASTSGLQPALAGVGSGDRINVYTNDPLEAAYAVERRQTFARNGRHG